MSGLLPMVFVLAQVVLGEHESRAAAPSPDRVEIVVFSDFTCPFCAQFAKPIHQLQAKGVDGIPTTVRFKHFPLEMHPEARLAYQAALAAGEQSKFWEMHDLLFVNGRRMDGLTDLLTLTESVEAALVEPKLNQPRRR